MVADLATGRDLGAAPVNALFLPLQRRASMYTRGFHEKPETLKGYKVLPTSDSALTALDSIYARNPTVEGPSIINCSFEVEMNKAENLKKTTKGACNDGFIIVVAARNDEASSTLFGNITITLLTWEDRFRLKWLENGYESPGSSVCLTDVE